MKNIEYDSVGEVAVQKKQINFQEIIDGYREASLNMSRIYKGFVIQKLAFSYNPNTLKAYRDIYYIGLIDSNGVNATAVCPTYIFDEMNAKYNFSQKTSVDITIEKLFINKNGKFTITISSIVANGVSQRELDKRRIIKYCKSRGYYTRAKKSLPMFIHNIGLITTNTGNTQSDILQQTGLNSDSMSVYKCDSNERSIAYKVKQLSEENKHQIIVLFRGGNEDEHMLKFSHECVLDEIVNSDIFTASAIGHESDKPIVQDIVDMSFPTPSSFANFIKAHNKAFKERIDNLSHYIEDAVIIRLRSYYSHVLNLQRNINSTVDLRVMEIKEEEQRRVAEKTKQKALKQKQIIVALVVALVIAAVVIAVNH